MTIEVNKNYVNFNSNTKVNKKEFKATPLYFIFSEEYKGLTCKAVFSKIPSSKDEEITYYQEPIINNKCYIPYEVMSNDGIMIGVYGYQLDGNDLVVRYSPEPKNLWFLEGSYYDGASTPEEISPSQFEQYTAYLNGEVERLNKIKIETKTITNGVKIEVTNSDGETTTTEVHDGEKGERGEQGIPGEPGTTDYEDLTNKPSINGTTLEGDVSLEDIGIGSVFTIKGSVSTPEDLPLTGNSIGDVYYVESVMAGYVWIEVSGIERWEELGEPIDLTNYYTKTETNTLLGNKQDTLTAGSGIDITNNVISASGGGGAIEYLETVANTTYTNLTMKSLLGAEDGKWYVIKNNCYISYKRQVNTPTLYLPSGSLISLNDYNVFVIKPFSANNPVFYYFQPQNYAYQKSNIVFEFGAENVPLPLKFTKYNDFIYSQLSYIPTNNTTAYTPTADYHPATKKYVDDKPTTYSGYDATKTQVLKNINGTLTWVDEV